MAIKAIAVDIDGTLTNDKKQILPRTHEMLIEAQRRGILLILASGRPAPGLGQMAEELELARYGGLLVSLNGGHVEKAGTGEVLFDQPLPRKYVKPLLEHLKNFDVIPWAIEGEDLCLEDASRNMITLRGEPINIVNHECTVCNLNMREVDDLSMVCGGAPGKILAAGSDYYLEEHWEAMAEPFKDELSCMFTSDFFFEFMASGISKGAALASALPKLGIDASEVVAFGDAQNDLTMIEWAGTGVAMGNATDEVKAAANMVTASNNEEGIAVALERLLEW